MPTALENIHALARETVEFGTFVTTGTGDVDELVCSTLANDRFSSTEFANAWALIESGACAGQVASLKTLTRTTGALSFYNDLTTAVASGVAFSVYKLLPPIPDGSAIPSFLDIVNQTLPRVWAERTISFTGVTGQQYYTIDTASHPWWTDDSRIMWVQAPTSATNDWPRRLHPSRWEWDTDGETKRLYFHGAPANTGQTFTVKVYAPGNSRLILNATARATIATGAVGSVVVVLPGSYSATPTVQFTHGGGASATAVLSGTQVASVSLGAVGSGLTEVPPVAFVRNASDTGWANTTTQTAGLLGITDEALPDVEDVKTIGKAVMYEVLSKLDQPGADVAEWLTKHGPALSAARSRQAFGIPKDRTTGIITLRPTALRRQR